MALTAATQTAIQRNWGVATLSDASFRGDREDARPGATVIDWDVVEQAIAACLSWFSRRGYSFDESSEEVRYYSILWIYPRHRWPAWAKDLDTDLNDTYVERHSGAAFGTGVQSGSVDDDRKLSMERLERMANPGSSRSGRPRHSRGGY